MSKRNLFLALTGGLLLGLPWSVSPLFFIIFIAWVPLCCWKRKPRITQTVTPYSIMPLSVSCCGIFWILVDHTSTVVGAILIMLANSLLQALVFWSISRVRKGLNIPLLFPFLIIWVGYEHFHESWDLAWPWLNLGNALATAPKSSSGLSTQALVGAHSGSS